MSPILGIDPGADGGAVLLDPSGRRALAAWGWRRRTRKAGTVYALSTVLEGEPVELETLHRLDEIGRRLAARVAELGGCVLTTEGLFVPKPRRGQGVTHAYLGRVKTTLTLAESAALLYGPSLAHAVALYRPLASTWRPSVLGVGMTASSDAAEAAAVAWVGRQLELQRSLGALCVDPHVAEAACIAWWGRGKARQDAAQEAQRAGEAG